MALTAAEQYMLELINRARLDPLAEAARQGIGLNDGLAPGSITGATRQVLAPNGLLETAAMKHSLWLLAQDVFQHEGINGSSPSDRVSATGYGSSSSGENLSWRGTTGSLDLNEFIADQHRDLFLSSGHRQNMLTEYYREAGIAQEAGDFDAQGHTFNASMITQNFSRSGMDYFVTGVAYNDANGDGFYSIGEGMGSVRFASGARSSVTGAAGGYALKVSLDDSVEVRGTVGARAFSVTLDVSSQNAKLDIVNGSTFLTSADITLGTGINRVQLLGTVGLDATGNGAANTMFGNKGDNDLVGKGGADKLYGKAGSDNLYGNTGSDRLFGDEGDDSLYGGAKGDRLNGGAGDDRLSGEQGNDKLTGGSGADKFVFLARGGADIITDLTDQDQVLIDNAIWGGSAKTVGQMLAQFGEISNGNAVLDFNNGQMITMLGVTSLSSLADDIRII